MQWSKLKKLIESNFAESVACRVELRSTRYRRAADEDGRGYITIDKKEVYSFCTIRHGIEYYGTANEIREINKCTDYSDPNQSEEYFDAYDEADKITKEKGLYSQYEFYGSLEEYLSLPFDRALESENLIIKSLAILDRRLGKRRILKMGDSVKGNPLLEHLFNLRCEAEGLKKSALTPK